jgi:hypothetical protein
MLPSFQINFHLIIRPQSLRKEERKKAILSHQ